MPKNIISYFTILLVIILTSCQDNFWEDHYSLSPNATNKNLMEVIEQQPELSKFAAILKATGYDKVLSASQSYTVWAPTNDVLESMVITDTINSFIENHIARYSYSTSDLAEVSTKRISMLNGKSNSFEHVDSEYYFAGAKLLTKDKVSSNGVLHIINSKAPFFNNIWESVNSIAGLDSISKYLSKFDVFLFDAQSSTEIGSDATGILYDSVFLYSNPWMAKYGRINKEDSVYSMILPDNDAWNSSYAKIKSYFKTYDKQLTTGTTSTFSLTGVIADSLQRAYTLQTLAQDLIFRGKYNMFPTDSLISTSGNVFYNPSYLFASATKIEASNGNVYKVNSMPHKATESWHLPILVEAEKTNGRLFYNSSLIVRTSTNESFLNFISSKKYVDLTPSGTSSILQPELVLEIPNTLSAKYNIYCVVVPANEFDVAVLTDSTKLQFQLQYVDATGTAKFNTAIKADPVTNLEFITSPTKITKMLVAKDFKFPFANYTKSILAQSGVDRPTTVMLKVKTNVTSSEFTKKTYTRNFRIDCLILEPVNE